MTLKDAINYRFRKNEKYTGIYVAQISDHVVFYIIIDSKIKNEFNFSF